MKKILIVEGNLREENQRGGAKILHQKILKGGN